MKGTLEKQSTLDLSKNELDPDDLAKFEQIYDELVKDAQLSVPRDSIDGTYLERFEQIYQALMRLVDKEAKLHATLDIVRVNYDDLMCRYEQAMRMSVIDRQTIQQLQQQTENAWKLGNIASQKEKRTRETVNGMKLEVANLSKLVEQGVGLTMGQEYSIHEILNENDKLTDTILKLNDEIKELNKTIDMLQADNKSKTVANDETKVQLKKITQDLANKVLDVHQEIRKNEQLNAELLQANKLIETKESLLDLVNDSLNMSQIDNAKNLNRIKDLQCVQDKLSRENEIQRNKCMRLTSENESLLMKIEALGIELKSNSDHIQVKDELISSIKRNLELCEKKILSLESKLKLDNDQIRELTAQSSLLHGQIRSLQKSLESCSNECNIGKKKTLGLERVRMHLEATIQKMTKHTQDQHATNRTKQKAHDDSKIENSLLTSTIDNLNARIVQFEKDKINQTKNINGLTERLVQVIDELKLKEMQINDSDKRLKDSEAKCKQTEQLYENIRNENNLNAKNLVDIREEIEMYKKELVIFKNQNHNLKNSKTELENQITKLQVDSVKQEKQRDYLNSKIGQLKSEKTTLENTVDCVRRELNANAKTLSTYEVAVQDASKIHRILISERDILGAQLVRRNDEISLLYEKIRLLEKCMQRGDVLYAARLNQIRLFKNEMKTMHRQKSGFHHNTVDFLNGLKAKLNSTEKQLSDEKKKCQALEQPNAIQNVHRWRSLSGSDPSTYKLLAKVKQLQSRLIAKYTECADLYCKMRKKDALYAELKVGLERRLGSHNEPHSSTCSALKKTLRKKVNQLKVCRF
jgi:chromosome segregation ATPase